MSGSRNKSMRTNNANGDQIKKRERINLLAWELIIGFIFRWSHDDDDDDDDELKNHADCWEVVEENFSSNGWLFKVYFVVQVAAVALFWNLFRISKTFLNFREFPEKNFWIKYNFAGKSLFQFTLNFYFYFLSSLTKSLGEKIVIIFIFGNRILQSWRFYWPKDSLERIMGY